METDAVKPVFALMGEFSAGKSTLANLLLGSGLSRVKVTATQMPPVWFKYGSGNPVVVTTEGQETEIDLADLETVPVDTTAYIRVYVESDLLEILELIDMPGNSDPNMSADVWRRSLHHADGVIWCTHANQAWRQSEAAAWEDVDNKLYARSILLLTRFDKIREEKDRRRLVKRVAAEAADQFRAVLPISLLQASEAGEDREAWEASGAEEFLRVFLDIAMDPVTTTSHPQPNEHGAAPGTDGPLLLDSPIAEGVPQDARDATSVIPRRVAVKKAAPSERPPAERPRS
ncbi:MAG: dynamin family protein [Pseudomonadota bacterium]